MCAHRTCTRNLLVNRAMVADAERSAIIDFEETYPLKVKAHKIESVGGTEASKLNVCEIKRVIK